MVLMVGFEPTWLNRWILNPIRLPVPTHQHIIMERIKGIEPLISDWKSDVLPLNYIRIFGYWHIEGMKKEKTNIRKECKYC